MKLHNVICEVPYWDECNKNLIPWYKKGYWKKVLRKRYIKQQFKFLSKE